MLGFSYLYPRKGGSGAGRRATEKERRSCNSSDALAFVIRTEQEVVGGGEMSRREQRVTAAMASLHASRFLSGQLWRRRSGRARRDERGRRAGMDVDARVRYGYDEDEALPVRAVGSSKS